MGQGDVLNWSDQFEGIAWRLHPEIAVDSLKARALSTKVLLSSRKMATDAIAFIKTKEAAEAMLEIGKSCSDDLYSTARHWLKNRSRYEWRDFGIAAAVKALNRKVTIQKLSQHSLFKLDDLKLSKKALLGKQIFIGRGTCFVCHKMGDKGREIAPDLSLLGSKFNASVIKEAIVNPSSAIVFGYEMTIVKTKDGQVYQGFLLADHDPIIIKDIAGTEHVIKAIDVIKKETSLKSLMPSAKQLNLSDKDLDALATFFLEVAGKVKK